jgi:Fe-S cluster biogenesis protein NfuA/nitrite reductase/ring-hydroxylating ferredoxin subunit
VDDAQAREQVARIEGLLGELEELEDPVARDRATETVGLLLEVYGEALARVSERVGAAQPALLDGLADDELVSHLLLLHGLHPVPLEVRVRSALEEVRPYMESHGGGVELLGLEDGVVRLGLQGSCEGCPSSAMTLKLAVERAIHKAAPDVEAIETEGAAQPAPAAPGLIQLTVSDAVATGSNGDGEWQPAGGLPQLSGGGTLLKDVSGESLLFLRVDGDLYAYRPRCASCGASLEQAALEGAELTCAGCASHYDVRRAGRCLDAPDLHLDPVPLLVGDDGLVKVAVGAAV